LASRKNVEWFYLHTFQERTSKDLLLKFRWLSIRTIILVGVEDVVVVVAAAASASGVVVWTEEVVGEEGTMFV
jgi:hypothetical protein